MIRTGYNLINLVLFTLSCLGGASISRCSVSLDDSETDIQVLRFSLWHESGDWDAIYDIHTFEYLMCIEQGDGGYGKRGMNMVEVMVRSLTASDDAEIYVSALKEDYETFCEWLKEAKNYTTSDEFTNTLCVHYCMKGFHLVC